MREFPDDRLRDGNFRAADAAARYVLYWMTAARRPRFNFALQRAVDWARELERPLVVLESATTDNPYDSDRSLAFVLQGMADNQRRFARTPVRYYPCIAPTVAALADLVAMLAEEACLVVADDSPTDVASRHLKHVLPRLKVHVELIDSCGLVPLGAARRTFLTAHSLRAFFQKSARQWLAEFPDEDPLSTGPKLPAAVKSLPRGLARRFPSPSAALLRGEVRSLRRWAIDHEVAPVPAIFTGGWRAASRQVDEFINHRLARYDADHNHPDRGANSDLSPWLHHGHVSTHEVVRRVLEAEGEAADERLRLGRDTSGRREGFWPLSAAGQAFLDELVTWREVGYNMAWREADFRSYASLPEWARRTLADHARDKRPYVYSLAQLEAAETHDEIWNAAQRQLRREGRLHNYLRMLWGKRILEWSARPRAALEAMIHLNHRWALDGRDPNSYSGIFWVLGRYDRPWGPERAIFGKVRYMSSEATRRKVALKEYLERYGA